MALLPLDRSFFATAVIVQQQDADDGVLQKKKKAKLQLADIMQSIISELVLVQQAAQTCSWGHNCAARWNTLRIGQVAFAA